MADSSSELKIVTSEEAEKEIRDIEDCARVFVDSEEWIRYNQSIIALQQRIAELERTQATTDATQRI